jgi:site-specific recombinase XerD
MDDSIVPDVKATETSAYLQQAKARIATYAAHSKAAHTWKAYQADLRDFTAWCETYRTTSLPASPEIVAAYLTDVAQCCKVATIQRRLSAISQRHAAAGLESPTRSAIVRLTMQDIRRTHAPMQVVRKVQPAVTGIIYKLVDPLGTSLIDQRDRALILLGFAGAFRRSELAQLRVADITETEDGLRVRLRQSKTDQEGEGFTKGIPYGHEYKTCPVRAWRSWKEATGIIDGQAFRSITRHSKMGVSLSDRAVAEIIKRRAKVAGLEYHEFSGHSLRAGLATAAAQAGVSERVIAKQTGHKSLPVLRGYIREGSLFTENAAAKVGL